MDDGGLVLISEPSFEQRCQEVYIRIKFSVSGCLSKGTMAKRAGEASSSGERWLPEVLPEHTIFLSHSGHDKPFVERLCEELKRVNHSPFFDQNSDSLPIGEKFPPLIFKAAEQCLLAVIVLSKGYLTSKWPMLELAAFVKAKESKNPDMKLLPLFYKLPPSDLVPGKWIESWKKLATDGKIHAKEIELWSKGMEVLMKAKNVETERMTALTEHDERDEIMPDDVLKSLDEAVKDLRPFNGLEFSKFGRSEGKYIEVVVNEICNVIPPIMKYNTDGIRGYQRMCEKAASLFEEGTLTNDICKPERLYLGFYGMGGVGKTTLCEAMCSFHQVEFRGRVCHVDLQSDKVSERLQRLKHVIRELGGCDDRVFQSITTESQGLQCLHDRLKSQPPAFLAVDSVGDSQSSRDEARRFISCGLACGSKVMVTSRSRLILESVLGQAKYCKPIPRLEEQEAAELFLSVAIPQKMLSPLQLGEDVIVKECVQECKFLDDGYDTQQYHPLVLRALGSFFHDVDKDDILKWEEALKSDKKLQASRESKHINDILGLNYATLSDAQKLLFLDVVFLFNLEKSSVLLLKYKLWDWEDEYQWDISLIAALHGISTFDAKMKVKELQRKSFIFESSLALRTHDLYVEFARSMVSMEGSKEKEWWVGQRDANGYNLVLKRLLLFEDESKICHPPKQLSECQNLECLIMHDCEVTTKPKLDLKCFPHLRLLIIAAYTKTTIWGTSGDALDCDCWCWGRKDQNKGGLPELRMVKLSGFNLRHLPFLKQCWNLAFLSIDDCDFDILDFTQDGTSLFENLKALETLLLSSRMSGRSPSGLFNVILRGATELNNLKYLKIDLIWDLVDEDSFCKLDLSALGCLTSLATLSLPNLPHCIKELTGLDQLIRLIELNLLRCEGLRKLPNLDVLPNLRRICVHSCLDLKLLEDQLKCFQKLHSRHQCLELGFLF